jgi:hypothetical protein
MRIYADRVFVWFAAFADTVSFEHTAARATGPIGGWTRP